MSAAGTLIVRADASTAIGTGHVMRSLALAEAWRASGGRVVFLGHCPATIAERIRRSGFELVRLDRPETTPDDLVRRLTPLLENSRPPAWVALDGYGFDTACHRAVRALGARLLVPDDLGHLAHYAPDLLVNPNLKAQAIEYACDEGTALALGPRYVLLRPEFRPWIGRPRRLLPVVRKVLVVLGGSDPENVSGVVLEGLAALGDPELHARVVVGPANPHLDDLRRRAGGLAERVELLVDPADMPSLMAWADVAVTAAGTTCWELALMQLPALAVVVAANQHHSAATLAEAGMVEHLGRAEELTPQRVADALARLCGDFDRRLRLAAAGAQRVDGRGADRVVALMRALDSPLPDDQLTLRFARPDDLMPLLRLSNEPSVRRSSLCSDPITLDEHTQWFTQRLLNPDVRMWVLDYQELLLAHIRYVRVDPAVAEISLAVAPAFRRRGLAHRLLDTRNDACEDLRVNRLRAVVRVENHASLETFRRAGFRHVDSRPVAQQACHIFEWEPA